MQQTDKYKLNKPGVDDPITPVPLNENMDKLEAAITDEAAARAAGDEALSQRVTVLEAHKLVVGEYWGNGKEQDILLGLTPRAVIVSPIDNIGASTGYALEGIRIRNDNLCIIEGGFRLGYYNPYSMSNQRYYYIAFS